MGRVSRNGWVTAGPWRRAAGGFVGSLATECSALSAA